MKLGSKLLKLDKLESTSKLARDLAEDGEAEGTVVEAEVQTAGTGRLERSWASPKGGLWFSIILRPPVPPAQAPKLTLLAGVAVAAAIRTLYRIDAHLKWPNDIIVEGKKLCGILSESRAAGEKLDHVIIGIGINANFPVSALPEELRKTDTTLCDELGKQVNLDGLLRAILSGLEMRYQRFCGGDTAAIIEEWKMLTSTLGNKVKVATPSGNVVGVAEDVDPDGALVVKTAKGHVHVVSGDII